MAADQGLNDPPRASWDNLFKEKKPDHEIHGLIKVAGSSPEKVKERLDVIQTVLGHNSIIFDIENGLSPPSTESSRVDGKTRPGEEKGKEQ
jgi:hypothetical protein